MHCTYVISHEHVAGDSHNTKHQEIQPEQHLQQSKYCIILLCVEINKITYKTQIWYTVTFQTGSSNVSFGFLFNKNTDLRSLTTVKHI